MIREEAVWSSDENVAWTSTSKSGLVEGRKVKGI